ncbi:MAG: Ig-like domain-containing protein [Enterobacter hormaechei]
MITWDRNGPLSNGQRTDDASGSSGISEAGTVTFYDNGKPIGTAADATGKWSFTPSTNLSEGSHAITTTATDAAGTSPASTAVTPWSIPSPGAPASSASPMTLRPGTGAREEAAPTTDPQLTGAARKRARRSPSMITALPLAQRLWQ